MSRDNSSRQYVFLGASLVLHFLIVLTWGMTASLVSIFEKKQPSARWVEVELEAPPAPKKANLVQAKERVRNEVKRTVLIEKSKEAANDSFLGEQTQKLKEQTATENSRLTENKPQSSLTEKKRGQALLNRVESKTLSQLGLSLAPLVAKNTLLKDENQPEGINEESTPTYIGGDQLAHEYVKGLKRSEKTVLNTKEFVFFGYFERIRSRLDLAWSSTLRDQLTRYFRRGRRLANDMDYTTSTLVTLNQTGEVIKVQILAESGTRDLDDAAVKAFNNAGPFPNPPKGIIDKSGSVQIRWDFVLRN